MVTIKQIAEICGVSRGTVDRVLNNRGKVKPEKAKLIRETAARMNYRPDPAGKALAARKKSPVVGVILPSIGVHFFDDVILSMQRAAKRYESYGLRVIWHNLRGFKAEEQCNLMDELASQVQALIINPLSHPNVVKKINELIDKGIFVITVNNDAPDLKHHCYVGTDYLSGGRTASALLQMIGPPSIRCAVLLGSLNMLGHHQRLDGFGEELATHHDAQIIAVRETEDDDMIAYEQVKQLLAEHPEMNSLFVISSGAYGAARALMTSGRKDITTIVFDTIPTTIRMMQRGIIQAAIYQHPHQQGRRSMQVAFEFLINGQKPEHDQYIMQNEIRILANVE